MAIDLGDALPLSISITNSDGQLSNATEVTLVITQPDNTIVSSGPIVPTSIGVYDYDYQTTQVGRHTLRWLATGVNASAFVDAFYVMPTDVGEFISLLQFKAHIKKTDNADDEVIRTFINAACQMIVDRVGPVGVMTVTEELVSRRGFITTSKYPIVSVTSLLDIFVSPIPNYVISDASIGLISTGSYAGTVSIIYRAGLATIPQNHILAALELTMHLWKNSQQNAGGGRPPVGLDEVVIPGVSYALPYNVRQLLGLDKLPRGQVFIG